MKNSKKMTWGSAICLVIALTLAAAAWGDEPATETVTETEAAPLQKLEPWRLEIQDAQARTAGQLADLKEEYDQAETPAEARRVEGEIRDLKLGLQVEILEIQAAEALRLGDEDLATRFEGAIERLLEKPEKKEPVERHEVQPAIN